MLRCNPHVTSTNNSLAQQCLLSRWTRVVWSVYDTGTGVIFSFFSSPLISPCLFFLLSFPFMSFVVFSHIFFLPSSYFNFLYFLPSFLPCFKMNFLPPLPSPPSWPGVPLLSYSSLPWESVAELWSEPFLLVASGPRRPTPVHQWCDPGRCESTSRGIAGWPAICRPLWTEDQLQFQVRKTTSREIMCECLKKLLFSLW